MEDEFSDELREIMKLIDEYKENNPDSQVIVSIRDFINNKDNLITYQFTDDEDIEESIYRICDVIIEHQMVQSGEPYGKFFSFEEFFMSYN